MHAVFDEKNFPARRFSPRIHDRFASLPSTHNELLDHHLSSSHYTPSPQHPTRNMFVYLFVSRHTANPPQPLRKHTNGAQ